MYHVFRKFGLIALSLCLLATMAFATNFDHCAEALGDMGLFRGNGTDYDLESVPNRAEAAVMLTRLLGKEDQAFTAYLAGEISHPFTDVPDWAGAQVAYLYENGLTTGATATEFESYGNCTAQMYTTFLLRALGYFETAGDFTYANALDFGRKLGVCDDLNLMGDQFLRDNVAALTYTTLSVSPKGESVNLLEKLVDTGAVAFVDGQKTMALFANYEKLSFLLMELDESESREFTQKDEISNTKNGVLVSSQITQADVTAIPNWEELSWRSTVTEFGSGDFFVTPVESEVTTKGYVNGSSAQTKNGDTVSQVTGTFFTFYDKFFHIERELPNVSAIKSLKLSTGGNGNTYDIVYAPHLATESWKATEATQSYRFVGIQLLESITNLFRSGETVDSTITSVLTIHNQGASVQMHKPF